MKLRTVLLLVGALLLLGVLAFVTDRAEQRRLAPETRGRLLPGVDPTKAMRVDVTVKGATESLVLKAGSWRVMPADVPADDDAIRNALKKLEALTRSDVAAENPEKHEALEVKDGQEAAVEVRVWTDGKDPAGELLIGKTGSDFQSSFVRVRGENQVYRTTELLRPVFDRGPKGWADRRVSQFEPDEAVKVQIQTLDGGRASFERSGPSDKWKMIEPVPGPAEQTFLEQIVGTLSSLQADDFGGMLADDFTTGLARPARSIVTMKDGTSHEVLWGKETAEGQVYAQNKSGELIYKVPLARMQAVFPDLAKLRGPEEEAGTTGTEAKDPE